MEDLLSDRTPADIKVWLRNGYAAVEAGHTGQAIYWFKRAGNAGSAAALLQVGLIYRYDPEAPGATGALAPRRDRWELARLWLARAIHCGSVDALQHYGTILRRCGQADAALDVLLRHYERTRSARTMVEIGRILQELAGSSVASVWFEEAVARGYVGGLQWLHLPLIQTREVHAAPAPLRLVRERAKWPEAPPMTKAAIDAPAYPLSRRVVAEAKPDQPSAYVFYLVDSASARMALAMELCSPQWERRNLQLASRILELIGAQQIRESGLLAAACEGTAEQRVTAGFVHALVGSDEWPKLFRGARGCSTGALMAGLCLFYGWKAARDYRAAGHFLGHCLADPLALLHLGVAASDRSWLSRALSLLRTEKLSAAYEWVGDLFADGIKVPRQREVATLWYGAALGEARAAGEELLRLVMKLDDVRTDNRAS